MRILGFLIFMVVAVSMNAQQNSTETPYKDDKFYLYVTPEWIFGTHSGGDVGLNLIWNNKLSFQFAASMFARTARNLPDDYVLSPLSIAHEHDLPQEESINFRLSAGRVFTLNDAGTIRLNLLGGIAYSRITIQNKWEKIGNSEFWLRGNYRYNTERLKTVSFILHPGVEFPISRGIGAVTTFHLSGNKNGIDVGAGAGLMIGLLRKRNKPMPDYPAQRFVNPRRSFPVGIGVKAGGAVWGGISVDGYPVPYVNLEFDGMYFPGFQSIGGGVRIHPLGGKDDLLWSPFFGFEAGYVLGDWLNLYTPIGVHYIARSGFDFSVDAGVWISEDVDFEMVVLPLASVKFGYRFRFRN